MVNYEKLQSLSRDELLELSSRGQVTFVDVIVSHAGDTISPLNICIEFSENGPVRTYFKFYTEVFVSTDRGVKDLEFPLLNIPLEVGQPIFNPNLYVKDYTTVVDKFIETASFVSEINYDELKEMIYKLEVESIEILDVSSKMYNA